MSQRKKKKQSPGIYYLLLLICVVTLAYEPVTKILSEPSNKKEETQVINSVGDIAATPIATDTDGPEQSSTDKKANKNNAANKKLEIPASQKNVSERILYRRGYTVSYNSDLKIPNWVAWELTPEKLVERESRTNKFLPDPDLPESEAVTTDDYKGAGLDRGHMCPAGDNRWHWRAMQESFYMTNICPQDHNLNRGDWKELEEACRRWAQEKGKIYIVCGPILYKGTHRTIGRTHSVTVPEAFFKVVLCMESDPPQAIGFVFKNKSGNHPLDSYVNSVDQVERITGLDFFPTLPDEVEKKVEATYDLNSWKRE